MDRIIRQGQRFQRRVVTEDEARAELADEPYKLELIGLKGTSVTAQVTDDNEDVEVGGAELTIYDNVDGKTGEVLLEGPVPRSAPAEHPDDRQRLGARAQRRRLLARLREEQAAPAHLRHRLGDQGRTARVPGAPGRGRQARPPQARQGARPVLVPRGDRVRALGLAPPRRHRAQEIEQHARRRHREAGYTYVYTPHISKADLFIQSNHLVTYKEGMFPPIRMDEEVDADGHVTKQGVDYYLKPMNCPMHILIYKERGRSYRDLPMRLAENGTVYRNELSGALHGLTRVRGFTQDDSHLFVTPDQLEDEVTKVLDFVISMLRDFGLDDFELELSMKDDEKAKWIGSDEFWDYSTNALRNVAMRSGLKLTEVPGEAAFYGPKIDLKTKDAIGRVWQLSTVQVDPNLPGALRPRVHRQGRHRSSVRS